MSALPRAEEAEAETRLVEPGANRVRARRPRSGRVGGGPWSEDVAGQVFVAAERGLARVEALFQFAMAASNLVRLPKLLATAGGRA